MICSAGQDLSVLIEVMVSGPPGNQAVCAVMALDCEFFRMFNSPFKSLNLQYVVDYEHNAFTYASPISRNLYF
jgi:hypothetical protein